MRRWCGVILACYRLCVMFLLLWDGGDGAIAPGRGSLWAHAEVLLNDNSLNGPTFAARNRDHANMDIVYLNLDASTQRDEHMRSFLQFYGLSDIAMRVSAFTPEEVHVHPSFLEVSHCPRLDRAMVTDMWQTIYRGTDRVMNMSLESDNTRASSNDTLEHSLSSQADSNIHTSANTRRLKRAVVVDSLCGRPKNTRREVVVTLSHLLALHSVIYRGNQSKPYALVLEDDLQLFMEVDFVHLLAAAPKDFGILQLVTSNDYSVRNLWRVFLKHQGKLFVARKDKDDYWCAGAYIVNKARLKPIVDAIFRRLRSLYHNNATVDQQNQQSALHDSDSRVDDSVSTDFQASIIAAYAKPCFPKHCCSEEGVLRPAHSANLPALPSASPSAGSALEEPRGFRMTAANTYAMEANRVHSLQSKACVQSPRGYQSDAFLFALLPVNEIHMLTLPLFVSHSAGNASTVHQQHVQWHQAAFRRAHRILQLLVHAHRLRGTKEPSDLFPVRTKGVHTLQCPVFLNPLWRITSALELRLLNMTRSDVQANEHQVAEVMKSEWRNSTEASSEGVASEQDKHLFFQQQEALEMQTWLRDPANHIQDA